MEMMITKKKIVKLWKKQNSLFNYYRNKTRNMYKSQSASAANKNMKQRCAEW